MSFIAQARMYWRFAWGLRGFLREPITLEQSREIVRQRLQNRDRNLLALVKRTIFENENSPYLKLVRLAGCEYGDFEHSVRTNGIEDTLRKLCQEGIYISIEEFKGKKQVARGGKLFNFKEKDFDNPYLSGHLETSSSGSRSAGTRTIYDFDFMAAMYTVHHLIRLDVYGITAVPFAIWLPIMPGGGPDTILSIAKGGITPVKWFSPVHKKGFKPSLKNRIGTDYIVYMGRFFGARLPTPEYVALDDAWIVAQWMADTIKKEGRCCMLTYTSSAVRICQSARRKGLDIAGAKFIIGGEPITAAKRKEIEMAGASAYPAYGLSEAGVVGSGCAAPASADDIHLFKDAFALIQHRREVPHARLPVDAFLITTLLPSAPKILFNVESGDSGMIETRSCGCKFEELGFTDHIHNIRGFDKLTGEGMTFIGTDLLQIIEEVLPSKFGGTSTDYQMVEEEDEQGHTHMSIVVSPEVGTINEAELVQTVLAELEKGQDSQRMMAQVWSQAGTLRVKRGQPFSTGQGKLLPLHIQRSH